MSASSEETLDEAEQVLTVHSQSPSKTGVKGDSPTGSQESKGTGCRQSFGPTEQPSEAPVDRHRKRTSDEAGLADARLAFEDEQYSFQSAFQQYQSHHHLYQQQAASPGHEGPVTASQAMQMLLNAATQSNAASHRLESAGQPSEVDGPSMATLALPPPIQDYAHTPAGKPGRPYKPDGSRVRYIQPFLTQLSQPALPSLPSVPSRPLTRFSEAAPIDSQRFQPLPLSCGLNPLYSPLVPKPSLSPQLIQVIKTLEAPAMDADSVQAALEFASAVQVDTGTGTHDPRQQHPGTGTGRPARLLQTLELSAGRLDALKILASRLATAASPDSVDDIPTLTQLLQVIQDLMRDMESSQKLLQQAGAVLRGHRKSALQQVDTLKAYHSAMQEVWTQNQQLDRQHAERRRVLQQMLMLSPDDSSHELLDNFEGLRQTVVAMLEASARKNSARSVMQVAQAQLTRQGVPGATPERMVSGAVQLVVERAVVRLEMVQRIVGALERNQAGLLAALTATLEAPAWHHTPHTQLAETVSSTQARADHLLTQLTSHGRHRALAPIKTGLTVVGSSRATPLEVPPPHHPTVPSPNLDLRHREEEWLAAMLATRQRQPGKGAVQAETPWSIAGPAKKSRVGPFEQPRRASSSDLPAEPAGHASEGGEHVVLKPLPQRASAQLASLQSASGTPLLHPPPPSSGNDTPTAAGHQDLGLPRQAIASAHPDVIKLLNGLAEQSKEAGFARSVQLAAHLQPASTAGTTVLTRADDVQASRPGSSLHNEQQDEGSPQEGQQGGAQPDLQGIAAAYAQLCAFLKQQKQPSPAVA